MKKCNPFYGQNNQLVHWWVLIHFNLQNEFIANLINFSINFGGKLNFILFYFFLEHRSLLHMFSLLLHIQLLYHSLGSISTLTKWIVLILEYEFKINFEIIYIFHHLQWYCDMSSEIIQNVTCEPYRHNHVR